MLRQMKRPVALFMSIVMVASLFLGFKAPAQASVDYVYAGQYVLNWGIRGENATYLSPMAVEFYEDNNTSYVILSGYEGTADLNSVINSALYEVLYELMEENHTHQTSYEETKDLYQYTDCENSGKTTTAISCFYSGKEIGPAWDSGNTWNREHVWPQSKSPDKENADDIMMLRPTAKSANSSRGNQAFGVSSDYFDPNGFTGGRYDVRGDVARILLYQYVRWGTVDNMWQSMWGASGVIESVEVLLTWMEADPVDTWELGRNDSVESITGTRNVFVDYPELGFLLFDEEVPANYVTPSGSAPEEVVGDINVVMFSQLGTVVSAQSAYEGTSITLPGHTGAVKDGYTFVGWIDTKIEETTNMPIVLEAGTKYEVKDTVTLYAVYSREGEGDGSTTGSTTYKQYTGALTEGDYLIVYKDENGALKAGVSSSRFTYSDVTISGDTINNPDASIIWKLEKDGSNWTLYNKDANKYAASTGAKNKGQLLSSATDNKAKWTVVVNINGTYEFENVANKAAGVNYTLRKNGTYGFATYSTSTGGALTLYKASSNAVYFFVEDGSETPDDTVAPVINGVVNGNTYYSSQNVTVSDENLIMVSVNTNNVENEFVLEDNKVTPYIIIAVDNAGNITTVEVMMKPVASLADSIKDITLENVKASDKDAIEAVIAEVEAVLADESLSDEEKVALQAIITNAEALLEQIEKNKEEIDTVAPVINGVVDGESYYTSQVVTVEDKNEVTITVNGEAVSGITFTLEGNKDATYVIVATDLAGNSTTVTVSVKTIAGVADKIADITVENVEVADEDAINEVLVAVKAIPTDDNTTDAEKAAIEAIIAKIEALLVAIDEIKNPPKYYKEVTAGRYNWEGKYIIVSKQYNKVLNLNGKTSDFGKSHSSDLEVTAGQIKQTDDLKAMELTFIKKDGGYAIKIGYYYIGIVSDSNTLEASTEDKYVNQIIVNADGTIDIKAVDKNGNTRYLRYNDQSDYFRFYKSGQKAITLYRLDDGSVDVPDEPTTDEPTTEEPTTEEPTTEEPTTEAPVQDPEADSILTIEQALALGASKAHNTYTTGKYYVIGEITEVYNTQYGNMKIKDANGNILTIYGTYSADGATRYDALATKPVAGDTVKIYGVVGQYNGTPQIKNGFIVEHDPAQQEPTTEEPTTEEPTTEEPTTEEPTTEEPTTEEPTTEEPTTEAKNDFEAELENKADVEDKIEFNDEEKEAIQNGADVEVKLEFKENGTSATTDEQKAIEKELGNKKIGNFLEISLKKVIGTTETPVTETIGKVTITFVLPDELKNTDAKVNRIYSVLRYHDGEVDVLDATYDEKTGKLSFETDKFSTYAVAYEDVNVEVPPTGDMGTIVLWCMILLAFGTGLVILRSGENKEKSLAK